MRDINTIEDTIAGAIGSGPARDYASYIDVAVTALGNREVAIQENLLEAARAAGLHDATATIRSAFGGQSRELAEAEAALAAAQERVNSLRSR